MITDQYGPLDDVVMFGHSVHGLIRDDASNAYVEVDRVEFRLSPHWRSGYLYSPGVLQIVRHPAAAPVALSPEVLQAERAQGRVWLNYAMVQRGGMLFGQVINGWIYIDSLGRRWVIRPGNLVNAVPGLPYTLELDCRPFGYLDGAPMEAVSIPVICPDIEQANDGEAGNADRFVSLETANGIGSRCILRLTPRGLDLPSGFLEIAVTDNDGELSASLGVLRSQQETRGAWTTTEPAAASVASLLTNHALCPVVTLAGAVGDPGIPMFPAGGGLVTLTVTGIEERDDVHEAFRYARYAKGTVQISSGRSGRLLAVEFDELDQLIETTLDTEYRYACDMPAWAASASGSMSNSGDGVYINTGLWAVQSDPSAHASRTVSERVEQTLTLRRSGVEAVSITSSQSYTVNHSAGLSPKNPGDQWWWASVGLQSGLLLQGVAMGPYVPGSVVVAQPTFVAPAGSVEAADVLSEKGGPWPQAWATPLVVDGRGDPQLAGSFPVGPVERDADSLQMAFGPVAWRLDPQFGGVRLREAEASEIREVAVLFPHAELLARGEEGRGLSVAYHPVEHRIAVSTHPSFDVLFV
ncbi:hypothetical protein [Aquipseudomonas campi]